MSLDLWLESVPCKECNNMVRLDSHNYTYNVAEMWYQIFPESRSFVDIDCLTGKESLIRLEQARIKLQLYPEDFKKVNPKNGWGSYESFLEFINNLIDDALEHPNYIWKASR
jgi:hypothetical protein